MRWILVFVLLVVVPFVAQKFLAGRR